MKTIWITIAMSCILSVATAQENKPRKNTSQDTMYYDQNGKIISQDSTKKSPNQQKDSLNKNPDQNTNKNNSEKSAEQNRQQNKDERIKKANSNEPQDMKRDSIYSNPPKK
ncbi:MAG: hypothetical protein M3R27_07470 [Bacteroidota bacterium]|nr:hypothetical protein [Bacteroidota bacterium]